MMKLLHFFVKQIVFILLLQINFLFLSEKIIEKSNKRNLVKFQIDTLIIFL